MSKYLYQRSSKRKFKIVSPDEREEYERNNPGANWELVEIPRYLREAYGGKKVVWMGNNPEFVEVID